MTAIDLTPFHISREGRAIRARIIRIARMPAVELSTAALIVFATAFAAAFQL